MRTFIMLLLGSCLLVSCGKKVKDVNQDENLESTDFIESFQERSLPVMFQKAELDKKESDSFYVKSTVVDDFIPDSVFAPVLGKTKDVKFYRKGRYKAEDTKETYLFLLAERRKKKTVYLICFNPEDQFSAAMVLTENNMPQGVSEEAGIDKRLTVIKTRTSQSAEGKGYYKKSAYVYNTEGLFTLILTESNEPVQEAVVFNPIDTLPAKDPLSGDYKKDKRNFVSVRDGGKSGKLNFFIHIEKPNGSCDGSMRGDMVQVKPKVYHYSKADDHCVLEFTFSGKKDLQVRELEACGNHRGVRCNFDGRFSREMKARKP